MKKSTIIYLVLLIIAAVVAFFVLRNPKKGTIPVALRDFAVEDTAAVNKIFLADKHNNKILLERTGTGNWIVNGKYKAFKERVDLLLETIRLVDVKNPVPITSRDNYMRVLATDGVKTEIYQDNKLIKTYYVGGTTPDELGTIMLLDGSSEPFVTHIPGFYGYLSIRYFTDEIDWRNRDIFAYNPQNIKMVELNFPHDPAQSFRITKENDNKFWIKSLAENKQQQDLPALTARSYLMKFAVIEFENFVEMSRAKKDSISNSQPALVVTVQGEGKKPERLQLYRKQADKRTKDVGPGNVDEDKFYGIMESQPEEILLVQRLVMDKILRTYSNFMPE